MDFIRSLENAKFVPKLMEKYSDINGELPLVEELDGKGLYIPSNTHSGQRKLLLKIGRASCRERV